LGFGTPKKSGNTFVFVNGILSIKEYFVSVAHYYHIPSMECENKNNKVQKREK